MLLHSRGQEGPYGTLRLRVLGSAKRVPELSKSTTSSDIRWSHLSLGFVQIYSSCGQEGSSLFCSQRASAFLGSLRLQAFPSQQSTQYSQSPSVH